MQMQSIHLQHPTFPSLLGDGWNVSTSIIAFFRFDTLLSFSLSLSLSLSLSISLFLFLSLLSVNRYHVNGGKKYLEQNKTKHDSDSLNNLQALGEIFLSIIKKLFCLALTPVLELVDT
jgi:hypothetical protein